MTYVVASQAKLVPDSVIRFFEKRIQLLASLPFFFGLFVCLVFFLFVFAYKFIYFLNIHLFFSAKIRPLYLYLSIQVPVQEIVPCSSS